MATLQNIRKRGPLIAIVVGLALFAFIVGDMVRGADSMFGKSKFNVAVINGEALTIQEYNLKVSETEEYVKLIQGQTTLETEMSSRIRSSVWDMLVKQYVLLNTIKELGIGVHPDELSDMVMGSHIDPIVKQTIVNPNTGQFDKNYLIQVLKNMDNDPTIKQIWMYIEREVKENRIYDKYFNLIEKGLYVTTLETKNNFNERNHIVDIEFISKKYETISDSSITVTDEELKNYYEENKQKYEQEEARDIIYVTFDVIPTKEDSLIIYEQITKNIEDFKTTENIEEYINVKSDVPFQNYYYRKGELLDAGLDTTIFATDSNIVYGPYQENEYYKLAKLVDIAKQRPDSVTARHILISPQNPAVQTEERAKEIADSIKILIDNGEDFNVLLMKHTDDSGTKDKGGKYENITELTNFVPEFKDFCFENNTGDIEVVKTQYGYHIIEILEQSKKIEKRKIVFVQLEIIPTKETYNDLYTTAAKFSGENNNEEKFLAAIDKQGLTRKDATDITQATNVIPGIETTREIVRWIFANEKGTVSPVIGSGERYVVTLLSEVREKGIAKFEQMKEYMTAEIRKDKKAEQIIADMKKQNSDDFESLAISMKTTVMTARNVSFNAFQIVGAGYEPSILALISSLEENIPFGPVKGKNAVYMIKATSITPPFIPDGYTWDNDKDKLIKSLRQRVNSGNPNFGPYKALKTLMKIEDNRAKFF